MMKSSSGIFLSEIERNKLLNNYQVDSEFFWVFDLSICLEKNIRKGLLFLY